MTLITKKTGHTPRDKLVLLRAPIMVLALLAGGSVVEKAANALETTKQEVVIQEALNLRAELEKSRPGTVFTEIIATPVKGLFEVWMGSNVAYVFSHAPRYFFFGHLFDTETMRDLTMPKIWREELPESEPVKFDQLPFKDAIKTVRGTGERQVAVFSDPDCPYCHQLEAELLEIGNVTIHTFPVTFKGEALPVSIWCAKERHKAWQDFMLRGETAQLHTGEPCPHPIARNLILARALGISGTPTLIWADGSRTEGFIDRAVIEKRLSRITGEVLP